MSRAIIKIGDIYLRDYSRVDAAIAKKADGSIEHKIHISRKKTDDKLFTELFAMNEAIDMKFYDGEDALSNEVPSVVYPNMLATELGISINPPNYSVQERIVYEPSIPVETNQ